MSGFAIHGLKQTVRFTGMLELTLEQKYQLGYNWGVAATLLNLPETKFDDLASLHKIATAEYAKYTDIAFEESKYQQSTDPRAKSALEFVMKNYTSSYETGYYWGIAAALFGGPKSDWWTPLQNYARTGKPEELVGLCSARLKIEKISPGTFPI